MQLSQQRDKSRVVRFRLFKGGDHYSLALIDNPSIACSCEICLKTGHWPQRLHDVEEIDVVEMQMKEAIHVSEEERQRAIEVAHQLENSEVSLSRRVAE